MEQTFNAPTGASNFNDAGTITVNSEEGSLDMTKDEYAQLLDSALEASRDSYRAYGKRFNDPGNVSATSSAVAVQKILRQKYGEEELGEVSNRAILGVADKIAQHADALVENERHEQGEPVRDRVFRSTPSDSQEQMQPQPEAGPGIGYGAMEEEEDSTDEIVANLEAHLNSLPEDQKAFLAEYGTTPEGAMLIGLIGGSEVYEYMSQFIDPSKSLTVAPSQGQAAPQGVAPQGPQQGQPVAAQAPQQGQPAPQPAQGVFQAQ